MWAWVPACAAGAGLVLLAAGRDWAVLDTGGDPAGGGAEPVPLAGAELAPFLGPVALAALAAVVAVLATRGWPRRAVGAVIALCGAGVAAGVWAGTGQAALARAGVEKLTGPTGVGLFSAEVRWGWPAAAAAGGLVLLAAGAAAVLRGGRWPGMSARYDRREAGPGTAAGPAAGPVTDRALWDALDRGADPTADPAADPAADPDGGRRG
nr:TIGR02234 family membrane protein [Planomonospora venezuelensis]